jgi:hypothetical protein
MISRDIEGEKEGRKKEAKTEKQKKKKRKRNKNKKVIWKHRKKDVPPRVMSKKTLWIHVSGSAGGRVTRLTAGCPRRGVGWEAYCGRR